MTGDIYDRDRSNNRPLGQKTDAVDEKEKVALAVDFKALPDGTNYAVAKSLNVAAKKIVVKISDSNYRKLAQ